MKRGLLLVVLVLCFTFVNALPENFVIDDVIWAFEGTAIDEDGSEADVLFGFLNVSWDGEGKVPRYSRVIIYMSVNGEPMYNQHGAKWETNFLTADFLPLDNFVGGMSDNELSFWQIAISNNDMGDVALDDVKITHMKRDVSEEELYESLYSQGSDGMHYHNSNFYNPFLMDNYKHSLFHSDSPKIFTCSKAGSESGGIQHNTMNCYTDCLEYMFPEYSNNPSLYTIDIYNLNGYYEDYDTDGEVPLSLNSYCSVYELSEMDLINGSDTSLGIKDIYYLVTGRKWGVGP